MLFADPHHFDICTYWDGKPCENQALWGTIDLHGTEQGLKISASLPHQAESMIPDAPQGSRVANLWEYDVVECFLVGKEKYLEIELGAGGHFLIMDFTAPRVRDQEYEHFFPQGKFVPDAGEGKWRSSIVIPWHMIPEGLHAANAFVIVRNQFVCASPLPGSHADFHQPGRFPALGIQ
jgi:hypothetical protein